MRNGIIAHIGLDQSWWENLYWEQIFSGRKSLLGAKSLLGERFRALFRGGGEVDRRQKGAHQQQQQVDFHAFLRCFLQPY
ncbi:hypothetical protein [Bradyrhizobium sp. S69]|jgi:hypothetical protein|uniref:hypothetical protein n=1 Tax=Bradyrhizobium sp. S69 TaxID=1641856 RepID=UPI00131C2BE5|nr:hypothetical protein [Bradyrhizobium sp. S69]